MMPDDTLCCQMIPMMSADDARWWLMSDNARWYQKPDDPDARSDTNYHFKQDQELTRKKTNTETDIQINDPQCHIVCGPSVALTIWSTVIVQFYRNIM